MRKTTACAIFVLGLAALMAACNNAPQTTDHEGHDHAKTETSPATPTEKEGVLLKDDQLNAIYAHYAHLTKALVKGDAATAKVAAIAIETGAKQIEGATALSHAASQITTSNNIAQQRKTYANLSNDLIALLKKTGMDSGELYVAYCPMALNDTGAYWLSNQKEILNPYFGDSMLTCGSVKETIK